MNHACDVYSKVNVFIGGYDYVFYIITLTKSSNNNYYLGINTIGNYKRVYQTCFKINTKNKYLHCQNPFYCCGLYSI